jgi:hypothetical protein
LENFSAGDIYKEALAKPPEEFKQDVGRKQADGKGRDGDEAREKGLFYYMNLLFIRLTLNFI